MPHSASLRVPQHVQSDLFFLDHTESEEAMMTEKEAISRNLNGFKADDLHIKHSITSVIRKQVTWADERQMEFY